MGKMLNFMNLLLSENGSSSNEHAKSGDYCLRKPGLQKSVALNHNLFKANSVSEGGIVKAKGEVLKVYSMNNRRPPNMNCRIESFGRICQKFDERRTRWVNEMGFGGLLNLADSMHLPRQLAYWIMTRIDPINQLLISPDGHEFPISKNHVRWILGIPCGSKTVPTSKVKGGQGSTKVKLLMEKYGRSWVSESSRKFLKAYTTVGIPVTSAMMDRLEGHYELHEEEEFKSLFLIVALQMVLCPTQSPRLAHDLIPALSCVMDCAEYDWCELVISKLMESVSGFARRFYANGFAGGCGGCSIFVVLFYLDRLAINPVSWNTFPRITAWSMGDITQIAKLDRTSLGDFGNLGMLDVAYGEGHPRQPRDAEAPVDYPKYNDVSKSVVSRGRRRRVNFGGGRKSRRLK